jgi:hypothetical protein
VKELVTRTSEPRSTQLLREMLDATRTRLDEKQLATMERWFYDAHFDSGVLQALRSGEHSLAALRELAAKLTRGRRTEIVLDERSVYISRLLDFAPERPAVVSALVWHWIGGAEPALASHLVQAIRKSAGLPGLRQRIRSDEPWSPNTDRAIHVTWFADRQIEDLGRWCERVPAPLADTFAGAIAGTEAQRVVVGEATELATFMRQIASFLLQLSIRKLDPLGFPLSREARLAVDPPFEHRLELAEWARTMQRAICLRGMIMVMTIEVAAPWPLALEVIATQLGTGACDGFGVLLRLRGQVVPAASRAPLFVCMPGETIEERGSRFERWLALAYPHAVDAWRYFT